VAKKELTWKTSRRCTSTARRSATPASDEAIKQPVDASS